MQELGRKDMLVVRYLIDNLSNWSMLDLYTAVRGECGTADLQQLYHLARQHPSVVRVVSSAQPRMNHLRIRHKPKVNATGGS